MTQLQWPRLVMWPNKTKRGQCKPNEVTCPEGKKLKCLVNIRMTTLAVTSSHICI